MKVFAVTCLWVFLIASGLSTVPREDAPGNLAIIGRYVLTPDIFDLIRDTQPGKGGEIQITDAMTQAQCGCVLAYKLKDLWQY